VARAAPAPFWRWQREVNAMENRSTFVLWISRPSTVADDPQRVILEGHLEQVDTGRELRFRSAEHLVSLLEQCMLDARESASA
jgi:hypothetical protein